MWIKSLIQTLKQIFEFCSKAKIVALMDIWKKETSGQATESSRWPRFELDQANATYIFTFSAWKNQFNTV